MAGTTVVWVVEDDRDILELLAYTLTREGYQVKKFETAEAMERVLQKSLPDLLMLDLMLPGKDGFSLCREIRASERTAGVPVIMVTARDEDADIVAGLEAGADDYVTKPLSARVLIARVKAVLRRRAVEPGDEADVLRYGVFEIDRARHEVRLRGKAVELTNSEFKALELFVRRPGIVFSRYQIVDAVHGEDYPVTDRSVDVLMVGLRKKLGKDGDAIETIRGIGYRMRASAV